MDNCKQKNCWKKDLAPSNSFCCNQRLVPPAHNRQIAALAMSLRHFHAVTTALDGLGSRGCPPDCHIRIAVAIVIARRRQIAESRNPQRHGLYPGAAAFYEVPVPFRFAPDGQSGFAVNVKSLIQSQLRHGRFFPPAVRPTIHHIYKLTKFPCDVFSLVATNDRDANERAVSFNI